MEAPAVVIRTISRYELLEEIGRANMGVVYRARDPAMDRIVAVKVIRLGFSLEDARRRVFLERFAREAQIAGKLGHPHIVSVHDFGSGEDGLAGRGASGLELRGRSRERGKEDEDERFEFTHLRPALSSNELGRYREALGLRD